jgi:hypothetical protein
VAIDDRDPQQVTARGLYPEQPSPETVGVFSLAGCCLNGELKR